MPESREERNRRLRAEKRKSMIQSMLKKPEPVQPEPEAPGAFSGREFDPYKDQEEYGVYLKFKVDVNPATKQPTTYIYWTHDFIMNFDDAKNLGTVEKVDFPGSIKFFNILGRLENQEKYVHIYVDNTSMAADPVNFNKLKSYLENNEANSETIGWEFGDPVTPRDTTASLPTKELKPVSLSKEKFAEFQQKLMDQIRKTRSVFNKYISADTAARIRAQKVGIDALAAGDDVISAVNDVSEFLDTTSPISSEEVNQMKESSNQNIRKLLDVLNELEVKDPTVKNTPAANTEEIPLNQPGGFNVVILNDPVTPAEVVAEAVAAAVGIDIDVAWERMESAHRSGWAVVATYAQSDIAETVADRIMQHARANRRYDRYRPHIPPRGYFDPWPLAAEVMEAG